MVVDIEVPDVRHHREELMARLPVRARRLTDEEGQTLLRIVRRGKQDTVRFRRALIIMASASGTPVPAIARLVAAHEDTVRDVIHTFNTIGLAALHPRWAGGRPRLTSPDEISFITRRPTDGPRPWAGCSPTGVSANSPTTSPTTPYAPCTSAGNGCAACYASTASRFSAPAPGKNRPIQTRRPSSPASNR